VNRDCIPVAELEAVLALAENHPRRRHLETCPRCRALLLEYRDFLSTDDIPEGADPVAAERALGAALGREMETVAGDARLATVPGAGRDETGRTGSRDSHRPRGRAPGWWFARQPAGVRALAAVLALVVVGGASVLLLRGDGEPAPDILRSSDAEAAAWDLTVVAGRFAANDAPALRLAWTPRPGADAYEVRVYATDLDPRGTFGPFTDTTAVVPIAGLDEIPAPGDPLLVRVVALAGGDEQERSPLVTVAAP
jgi:hypothetical protein